MRIDESSDQAPGHVRQDTDPQPPGPPPSIPDPPSPSSSEAPPSYSAVPPTNDTSEDFEGDHPMSYTPEDSTPAPTNNGNSTTAPSSNQSLDILDRIPNLFRLLDLVEDRSSGGIVEKIVIDQKSLSKVINILQPGSYKSVSNIDFKALDNLTIKPIGVYGNQHEILNYLQEVGCLDHGSEQLVFKRDSKGEESSALRSGLYLTMSRDSMSQGSSKTGYIFYWPEESTWDDQAASLSGTIRRNRETFMRYLTKLSEQTVALISPSQAKGFIWETRSRDNVIPEHQRSADAESRLEEFQVFELDEQKEDAIASPGFKVSAESILPIGGGNSPANTYLVPGEERIGLLTQKREEARTDRQRFEEPISQMKLHEIIRSQEGQPRLVLGKVSPDSMKILASNGLREEYPDAFRAYDRDVESLKNSLNLVQKEEKEQADEGLAHDKPMVAEVIRELVHQEYVRLYPSMLSAGSELNLEPEVRDLIYARYYESGLDRVEKDIQQHRIAHIQNTEFRTLKTNWLYLKNCLDENSHLSEIEKEDLVNKVAGGESEHSEAGTSAQRGGFVTRTARFVLGKVGFTSDHGTKAVNIISDAEFMGRLPRWEQEYPSLARLAQPIHDSLHKDMKRVVDKLMGIHLDRIIHQERKARYQGIDRTREASFKDQVSGIFESLLQSLKQAMEISQGTSNLGIMRVDSITNGRYQHSYSRSNNTWFHWRGEKHIRVPPQIHYDVYPLELTEHDRHQCQIDEDHVPKPRIASRQKFQFALAAASQSIEFIQIVQSKCLLVVSDSEQGHTRIFIEDNVKLSHATQSQGKITLYHDKLGGSKCFFAFDQGTRFLAVVHGENDLQVSVFEFDEQFSSLRRHRSPIDLGEWYDEPPEITGVCFQTGRPELCLIESSGRVRVLSLVQRMFCGAPLEIDRPIIDIFPAPDGSCLLVVVAGDAPTDPDRLLVFHWLSFGPNQRGIDATEVPTSDTRRVGTRFYGRGRIHVISFTASDLTLASTAIQVKQKTTEFAFLSENDGATEERGVQTLNNSLIDCHMEVWTRFPVVPAVTRDTLISVSRQPRRLIFISPQALPQAPHYFARMISTLRNTTNKPVGEDLVETIVSSTNIAKFETFGDISEFKLGSYFVELICLIPLHLAITLDNKFLPLKDGVWDPDYESNLVGATIAEVKDTLSLGWYESIFRTYMAKKASMQSIERSAQEDMLLVLFNTAISNLVLFRNNFALSRNIRGLFTSFQSSAKTFDPSTNPGLFNSTLAIIIKDVTNSDTNGIKKEFSLKFGEIVQMERDKNFISRLHRGKIQIIPWPVINSPEFYSLFNAVRKRLEMQDFTHQTGGAFLHKLKSLMVDIKAKSQASSRAHQLKERLTSALAHGKTAEGPLKNMNTDEDIPTLENEPDFFVPEIENQEQAGPGDNGGNALDKEEELAEKALTALIHRSKPPPASRPHMKESEYVEALQQGLNDSLDHRLGTVEQWIKSNTNHFTLENPDLRELNKSFTIMSSAMQAAVKLCQACCSQCKLLCLRAYRHSGAHQCGTDHRCVFDCEVKEEHEEQPPCGLESIDQAPSESKTQFTGKHEKFVYTRFTQVSKRLPCEVPVPAGQLAHGGPHKHDLKEKPFHFCNAKCPGCNYFCKLPLDHPQKFHSTNHGSMVETKWIVEPKKDTAGKTVDSGYKLENHKYGAGDEGSPMFCHMMCSKQGRHAHVDFCLDPKNHTTPACEHITTRMQPEPEKPKDWIAHATYWERTGFEDPYDPSEQTEFGKCDASCAGPEHVDDDKPSRCTLPIFHPPQNQTTPLSRGYVSPDGHLFHCVDPSRAQQAYHVIFMIDCSGSMTIGDHRPLANLPVTSRLVSQCNNRYGAVVSALYGFLKNREAAVTNAGLKSRQDSYTFLMHDDKSEIRVQNDLTSTTDQLIDRLIPLRYVGCGGNNFDLAIMTAQQTIEKNWSSDRAPMVVFLSDGEWSIDQRKIEDLCKKCIQLGHALAFYGISFGWDSGSSSLRLMANVADKSFRTAPMTARGAMRGTDIPCKYSTAIDSVQLAATFMSISESLPRSRASVLGKGGVSVR
ncbi:hypothetical protein FRC11_009018, partial [Ceratobasidium sp. 423]